jgi:hypothetical protein
VRTLENGAASSPAVRRAQLIARLRSRTVAIEQAIFIHLRDAMPSGLGEPADPDYVAGLRATITATIDYVLRGIEHGADSAEPIPSIAVAQAHRAARSGVGLDTVLLRYAAGNRLVVGYVMAEADHFSTETLRQVLDMQGALLERLTAEVTVEYKREVARAGRSSEQRRAELVGRLLAGEAATTADLSYELAAWHLGIIATGRVAPQALRQLAADSGRQLLSVSRDAETFWAWLGGQRRPTIEDIERLLMARNVADVMLAVGEPCEGIDGWRLTHQQAHAARLVSLHRPRTLTRYADEMLLAAALRDETLAESLTEIYLSPIAQQRDGGVVARETLRAYLKAGCNASSAASALGVVRHTVESRVKAVEQILDRGLNTCLTELEVALRLHELISDHLDGERAEPESLSS